MYVRLPMLIGGGVREEKGQRGEGEGGCSRFQSASAKLAHNDKPPCLYFVHLLHGFQGRMPSQCALAHNGKSPRGERGPRGGEGGRRGARKWGWQLRI